MYQFVRGPMMWAALIVFLLGIIYQSIQIISVTKRKHVHTYRPPATPVRKRKKTDWSKLPGQWVGAFKEWRVQLRKTVLGSQPGVTLLTLLFHCCLIVTPVFLLAHNVLLFESWKVKFFSLSEATTDTLTIIFLVCAFIFLMRRILDAKVRAITGLNDYLVFFITVLPFITGYVAYHQLFDYQSTLILHIISGELMIMSIGFTKLGHMVFFVISRFWVGSEHSFRGGSRTW